MKTTKIYIYTAFALALGLMQQSCKDNILTPVTDTKPLDSLSSLIAGLNQTLVSVNKKDNSFVIKAATLKDSITYYEEYATHPPVTAQYTVYLVDGSNSVVVGGRISARGVGSCQTCKTAGIDGATVTVNSGGQSYTQTSNDGRAIFNNISVAGDTKVLISAPGYTPCSIQTYLGTRNQTAGNVINVSTAAMLFPTTGSSNTTYTGQIFINTSVADDTLGRVNPATNDFLANDQPDPYDGENVTGQYRGNQYSQNTYSSQPQDGAIKFDKATVLAGINNYYAYPAYVSNFYNLGGNYMLGDAITVEYTSGLISFLKVDANGVYTVSVPTYESNPGTNFSPSTKVQANYTYLFRDASVTGATKVTFNNFVFGSGSSPDVWYSWTSVWDYVAWIQQDDGDGYYWLSSETFSGLPGETVTRNIYLFAWSADTTLPN